MGKINLKEKLSLFSEHWSPKVIAEMNDYQFKLVKIKGDFVWHHHADTDEVFIVIEGNMKIEFENETVELNEGDESGGSSADHTVVLNGMSFSPSNLNIEVILKGGLSSKSME